MKLVIKAKCRDCNFAGDYNEVYNHCKKTKHGDYGSSFWSSSETGRDRCNMILNKNDILKAILQASIGELIEQVFDYNKSTYKNFIEYLFDMYAVDRIDGKIEGDDIEDVISSVKNGEIMSAFKDHLKDTTWIDKLFTDNSSKEEAKK